MSETATNAAAARAVLVGKNGVLQALPGLAGVTVAYSLPRDVPREIVYGGQVAGSAAVTAMKGGQTGRMKRQEDLSLQLHVRVYMPGEATSEAGDARATAISAAIEEYVAGNPTLGDLPGLRLAAVEAVDLDPGAPDDDGVTSTLTLQIGLKSYLA